MKRLAIVGTTGLVGRMFLKILEEKQLEIDEYVLLASKNSKGKKIPFMNKECVVEELTEDTFVNTHFDYALFSAGSKVSEIYGKIAKDNGTIVIDNSSYYRMDKDVPLIVPEVNKEDIFTNTGIIANPNCSTIGSVSILKALENYNVKRVIYSTYQAVSGAGIEGINDLTNTRKGNKPNKFKYSITDNCIPQIDVFLENKYTKEEMKMINETRKILHKPNLLITSTCVRVPILNCHSESINIEFEKEFDLGEIISKLNSYEGIVVVDDINNEIYPINETANSHDELFVGRIRRDFSVENGINIWVVSDNIRKGAATNAVQILEQLLPSPTVNYGN